MKSYTVQVTATVQMEFEVDARNSEYAWPKLKKVLDKLDTFDVIAGTPKVQKALSRVNASGPHNDFWPIQLECVLTNSPFGD